MTNFSGNAKELAQILPRQTHSDMQEAFSAQKGYNVANHDSFIEALLEEPFITPSFMGSGYKKHNPQNQVLSHGTVYNALFTLYMRNVKTGFDSVLLYAEQQKYRHQKVIIDYITYDNLPKKYRGIFVKYDNDSYVLNIPYGDLTISYNKKNKAKVEKLLERAKMLLPVIYKEPTPDIDFGGLLQICSGPDFVKDSRSANRVTDEQLNTVRELHDIFVELAKITFPRATFPRFRDSAAYRLLLEHEKERNQHDVVHNANKTYKELAQQINEESQGILYRGKTILSNFGVKKILKTPGLRLSTPEQKKKQVHNVVMQNLQEALKAYTR